MFEVVAYFRNSSVSSLLCFPFATVEEEEEHEEPKLRNVKNDLLFVVFPLVVFQSESETNDFDHADDEGILI